MKRETPVQWLKPLQANGIHSARQLAGKLGISPQTATRLLHGEETSRDTIEAAATLLGLTPAQIHTLRGEVALPPFRLPPAADALTPRQRDAVLGVVRAMLEPHDATPIGAAPMTDEQAEITDAMVSDLAARPTRANRTAGTNRRS